MRTTPSILPLRVEHIGLERDGQKLLDDVNFIIPASGITIIIGPNGAGKSLTLRICNGLLKPDHGRVVWAHDAPLRHAIVFQRPVMLRRSVRANIVHVTKAAGRSDAEARADLALSKFNLTRISDRPARLLSGGEQQRLALARAWALAPEMLFLDEPTSQLDPGATREIEDLIKTLAAEGITLLMTTHDLGQARRLADRVMFFNRGRLLEDADATSFFTSPTTAEAKLFLAGELLSLPLKKDQP